MSDIATTKDLQDLEARLNGKLDAVESRIGDQVREATHESETRILKAIYEIAESGNKRMVALERSDLGLPSASRLSKTAS
jgi:hypothetical protein